MVKPRILAALEREYARLLGEHETAELAIEPVVGLAAIAEADRQISERKAALRVKMDRISLQIRVEFDAMWTPHHITPRPPRFRRRSGLSRAAYKVLKSAREPCTANELAKAIAPLHGIRAADNRAIAKLANAISVSFRLLLAENLIVSDGGRPIRWSAHVHAWRPAPAPSCAASAPLVRVSSRPGAANAAASPNTRPIRHRDVGRSPTRARF